MTIPAIAPPDSEDCFLVGLCEAVELPGIVEDVEVGLTPNESQRVNIF